MELLKKLTQTYSPSGNESRIRELVRSLVEPCADEVYDDNLGNLVVHKKGNGKKIVFAAHMDEIGLLVNYLDDKGFLRFAPLGGIMSACALYQSVEFESGIRGVVSYEGKEDIKKGIDITKMYVDIGAQSATDAGIEIGDSAVFCGDFFQNGDFVSAKAMDNRAGVYVLIKALMQTDKSPNDLYFVFTTQEELGCRGAKAAANAIAPDIALAVDVTDTGDTPECERMAVKLGEGPCIKYMDNSIITHKKVNDVLKNCAKQNGIPVQYEVLSFGGTDAGAIHTSGTGVMTGAVSIPTRYIHTPHECVSQKDLMGAIELIVAFASSQF